MSKSLLEHIASNFISQYENVANSSVAYLLNNYAGAQAALRRTLGVEEVPYRYVTEEHTQNGRPNVAGKTAEGDTSVIIEGKFWAALTDNQPNSYLKELAPTNGRLLFLAPGQRQDSLRIEIDKRLEKSPEEQREVCIIVSWADFSDRIENENDRNKEPGLASDLGQLQALCDRMDIEGMPPLTDTDLDPMNGRIAFQLSELINDCWHQLKEWDQTDFSGLRISSRQDSYYFYFRAQGFGCRLIFSPKLWFTSGARTPFWLEIGNADFSRSEAILNSLANWDRDNLFDTADISGYAIHLRPGMDRQAAATHIVNRTKAAIRESRSTIAD